MVKGNNLHRVVVYRDGGDKGGQMVPYTTVAPQGSTNPRKLWEWLAQYERKTGGEVLAIAHNGNLSNGMMFPLDIQSDGKPLDAQYVRRTGQVGTAVRGHPDQGRRRGPPLPVARMMNSPTTRPGISATSMCPRPRPMPCWRANTPAKA